MNKHFVQIFPPSDRVYLRKIVSHAVVVTSVIQLLYNVHCQCTNEARGKASRLAMSGPNFYVTGRR